VESFGAAFEAAMARVWRGKLGLSHAVSDSDVRDCAQGLQQLMLQHGVDHTLGWRSLVALSGGQAQERELELELEQKHGHDPAHLFGPAGEVSWRAWVTRWYQLARSDGGAPDAQALRQHNPVVVPRNHLVEDALSAASDAGDFVPFGQLLAALRRPFDEGPDNAAFARAAPPDVAARHRTFCGT
jgi:uncharacterized protein YdiU (UPF0061 family)